ncbi:hypothetical protein ACFL6I_20400 [candidate division KSB1 bacterium]
MKKITKILIPVLFFIFLATAVAASVSVTYYFRDAQNGNHVNNVDVLVYPCLDNGCNSVDLSRPLQGTGNSGSNWYLTVVYPTNLMTQHGYAAYYFANGYWPHIYKADWHGTGSTTFNINFDKKSNCLSQINDVDIDVSGSNNVQITADIESAFHRSNYVVGYLPPQYSDHYSSLTQVIFRIYDGSNVLVFQEIRDVNIIIDGSVDLTTQNVVLQPGSYRAEVRTTVTDNQCSNSIPQLDVNYFTIMDVPECSDGIDNDNDGDIDMDDDGCDDPSDDDESDDPLNPIVTLMTPADGTVSDDHDQTFVYALSDNVVVLDDGEVVFFDIGGTQHSIEVLDVDETICQIAINNGQTIVWMQEGNELMHAGTMSIGLIDADTAGADSCTFYIQDLSLPVPTLDCTLYGDFNGNYQSVASQQTQMNSFNEFLIGNIPDGTYNWNVECTDGQVSATNPWDFTLTINTSQPVYECSDDLDNDGDFLIDANDPGCYDSGAYDPLDDNETDTLPECSDFFDNDGDGLVDMNDPGCTDPSDDNETDPVDLPPVVTLISPPNGTVTQQQNITFVYQVVDAVDNIVNCTLYLDDGTGLGPASNEVVVLTGMHSFNIGVLDYGDYTWNVLCEDTAGNSAFAPDNWVFEIIPLGTTECSDGIDNDGDNLIDFPDDPGCDDANDDNETDTFVCQDNLEIENIVMEGITVGEDMNYQIDDSIITQGYMNLEINFVNLGSTTIQDDGWYRVQIATNVAAVAVYDFDLGPIGPQGTFSDVQNLTFPPWFVPGFYQIRVQALGGDEYNCQHYDQFDFYVNVTATTYECSDGFDNDNDGVADANDPGCYDSGVYDPFDDDETDTLPQCSDYFDNDGDGLVDMNDPGCTDPSDDDETDVIVLPECSDGIDNDIDGLIDFPDDPGCTSPMDNDETDGNQTIQYPIVVLIFPFNGIVMNESDIPFTYIVLDDASLWLNCTLYSDISGTWQPEQSLLTLNGFYGMMYEQNIPDGTYTWNVMCEDDDGNQGWAPENWTFTIDSSASIYQCNDGIDNDGDSMIDFPNDPGCSSPTDDDETDTGTLPECNDGIDNDNDGLIDFPDDPGCDDANDDNETDSVVDLPECSDGIDNDGDGLIDLADPDCQGTDDDLEHPEVIFDPSQKLYIGHIDIHSTTNAGFEQDVARAGDEIEISVYIENLADYDLEELKLRIFIDELGVWRSIGPFDLDEGDHTTKHVYVDIPEDAQNGEYDVRIVVENQELKRVKYRLVKVI